jgi:hypothetical protein
MLSPTLGLAKRPRTDILLHAKDAAQTATAWDWSIIRALDPYASIAPTCRSWDMQTRLITIEHADLCELQQNPREKRH